jgi:hypothetical protein
MNFFRLLLLLHYKFIAMQYARRMRKNRKIKGWAQNLEKITDRKHKIREKEIKYCVEYIISKYN